MKLRKELKGVEEYLSLVFFSKEDEIKISKEHTSLHLKRDAHAQVIESLRFLSLFFYILQEHYYELGDFVRASLKKVLDKKNCARGKNIPLNFLQKTHTC